MRSLHFITPLALALLLAAMTGTGDLAAQQRGAQESPDAGSTVPAVPAKTAQLTPAQRKFDAAVRAVEQALRGAPHASVKVESTWQTQGLNPEAKGTNHVSVTVANPGKLRLEASPGDNPQSKLTIVSDGKTLSRLLSPQNIYSQTLTRNPYEDLQADALTHQTLEGSGAEFLIRSDLHGTLMSQIVRVEDQGLREEKGRQLQGFHFVLASGREVEVQMLGGRHPVPVAMKTTLIIPVDDNKKFQMSIHSKLTWDFQSQPDPATFTPQVPKGARRVADLLHALTVGDNSALVGQPAPRIQLTGLDGSQIELPGPPGDDVIVLYFFATWAAPSVSDMPNIQRLRDEYTKRGVRFVPVDVGESVETLKAFMEKAGIRSTVHRDPKGEAIAALRTTSLPTVVIIAPDRTIQAFHAGAQPETKQHLRDDLDALLKGQRLARRPQ